MKNCSEKDTAEHLKTLLNSLTADLSLNFLERRGKNKSHKATLLDELQDVIAELNHRERDLQAAVGIALMVLESNEKLQVKKQKTKVKLLNALEKSHHQSIDIKSLQEALIISETRNEEITKTLIETEEIMLVNSAELNRIVRERFREADVGASEEEIELIKKDFTSQLDSVQKKRWELEKELKKHLEIIRVNSSEINSYKEDYEKLEHKYNKIQENYRELEVAKLRQDQRVENLEVQLKLLNSNFSRVKLHSERLAEEISILELKEPEVKPKLVHASSLQSELEEILDHSYESLPSSINVQNEESIDMLFMKPTRFHSQTPQTRTSSMISYFKLFSLCQSDGISVFPTREQRKKPPEEYFALCAQAVKMNATHLENLYSVSVEKLYEKAIKSGIPFHKWHVWIESEINAAYVHQLYKSKKTVWKRYGKLCL